MSATSKLLQGSQFAPGYTGPICRVAVGTFLKQRALRNRNVKRSLQTFLHIEDSVRQVTHVISTSLAIHQPVYTQFCSSKSALVPRQAN